MSPLPAPKSPGTSLRQRVGAALEPVAEVVVPASVAGAAYLVLPGHWEAFKAALVELGIPAGVTVFAAPAVAVAAIFALRYAIRQTLGKNG
jgi:hypothetical protein